MGLELNDTAGLGYEGPMEALDAGDWRAASKTRSVIILGSHLLLITGRRYLLNLPLSPICPKSCRRVHRSAMQVTIEVARIRITVAGRRAIEAG